MKNREEYIPQFLDKTQTTSTEHSEIRTCAKCGKITSSLFNGVCFECRQKEQNSVEKITKSKLADEDLYNTYCNNKTSDTTFHFMHGILWIPLRKYGLGGILIATSIIWFFTGIFQSDFSATLVLMLLSVVCATLGILYIVFRKYRLAKKFRKYNSMEIEISEDNEWQCPCCKTYNIGVLHCEKCGVLPRLIRK